MAETQVVNASDEAIELAKKEGIDINTIKGTGTKGTVTVPDVEKALKAREEEDEPEDTPDEGKADKPSKDEKPVAPKTPEVDMAKIEASIEAKVADRVKDILAKAQVKADEIVKNAEKSAEGIALKLKPRQMSSENRAIYRKIGLDTMKKLEDEDKVKIFIPYSEALKEKEVAFSKSIKALWF